MIALSHINDNENFVNVKVYDSLRKDRALIISFPDSFINDVLIHIDNNALIVESIDADGHDQKIYLTEEIS